MEEASSTVEAVARMQPIDVLKAVHAGPMHCQAEFNGVKVRKTVTVRREVIDAARSLFSACVCMHAH